MLVLFNLFFTFSAGTFKALPPCNSKNDMQGLLFMVFPRLLLNNDAVVFVIMPVQCKWETGCGFKQDDCKNVFPCVCIHYNCAICLLFKQIS